MVKKNKVVLFFCCVFSLSGCVPAILGVKEIKTAGGTHISFITGAGASVSANGLDTINDNRGIKPSEGR